MKTGMHPMTPSVGASGFVEWVELRRHRNETIEQTMIRCGRKIEQLLNEHGYVARLYAVLNASQISTTVDHARFGEHVRVEFPHPGTRVAREITADRGARIELFGGPGDGEHFDVLINDSGRFIYIIEQPVRFELHTAPVSPITPTFTYYRAGYDFESNRFIYTPTGR